MRIRKQRDRIAYVHLCTAAHPGADGCAGDIRTVRTCQRKHCRTTRHSAGQIEVDSREVRNIARGEAGAIDIERIAGNRRAIATIDRTTDTSAIEVHGVSCGSAIDTKTAISICHRATVEIQRIARRITAAAVIVAAVDIPLAGRACGVLDLQGGVVSVLGTNGQGVATGAAAVRPESIAAVGVYVVCVGSAVGNIECLGISRRGQPVDQARGVIGDIELGTVAGCIAGHILRDSFFVVRGCTVRAVANRDRIGQCAQCAIQCPTESFAVLQQGHGAASCETIGTHGEGDAIKAGLRIAIEGQQRGAAGHGGRDIEAYLLEIRNVLRRKAAGQHVQRIAGAGCSHTAIKGTIHRATGEVHDIIAGGTAGPYVAAVDIIPCAAVEVHDIAVGSTAFTVAARTCAVYAAAIDVQGVVVSRAPGRLTSNGSAGNGRAINGQGIVVGSCCRSTICLSTICLYKAAALQFDRIMIRGRI